MYHHGVDEITAFILAGGSSSRMGTDKAFLELGGRTLLARALELAGAVARDVRIVGDAKKFASFGTVVEDVYRNCGPLGGIHAALAGTSSELNLMLPVDLPFLRPAFLEYLTAQAREATAVVTVPQAAGGWQPLCAVYRRSFLRVAEQALREGRNKIDALFAAVETRVLDEPELSRAGFAEDMFRNLNTPEEWERTRINHRVHRGSQRD